MGKKEESGFLCVVCLFSKNKSDLERVRSTRARAGGRVSFALQLAHPKMARSGLGSRGLEGGGCSVRACDALLSVKEDGVGKKKVSAVFFPLAIRCFYDYVM